MLVCRDRKLNNAEFVRIVKNDNVTNVNAFEVLALFLYERESTCHCLPRDWIDKAIDDPSKGLCDHIDSSSINSYIPLFPVAVLHCQLAPTKMKVGRTD